MSLEGTIPALLTPFTDGGAEIDLDLLDEHVAWLAERGVRFLSPLGSTGEGVSLSLAERRRVIERLAAHPSGLGLLPGTGCNALPETIELSRFALDRGALGVLVAPPSYYATSSAGTTRYFARLLEALPPESPVFAYHIPSLTGVPIADETLRALGPGLAGVKDSGGDLDHTVRWLRDFPHLLVLSGSDAFASAAYAAGARATLTMLANVLPEELEGIRQGERAGSRQELLTQVRELVGDFPRHAALKRLLHSVSGLPISAVRPPLEELTPAQAADLDTRFATLRGEIHV